MTAKRIVAALGGNAILTKDPSDYGQKEALKRTANILIDLVTAGNQLIITHGNGPQVGNLWLQHLAADSAGNPAFKLDSLDAMTQGSIGYWLENALSNAFHARGIEKSVASLVTRVVVDKNDPAFESPSKPIGPFYTEEEMAAHRAHDHGTYVEDAGRGYRRVVPSPKPIDFPEIAVIQSLIDANHIVVCSGGGGVPVYRDASGVLTGVEAVIDKDFASEKLAELVDADVFLLLTAVDHVFINYREPNQQALETVTPAELEQYKAAGHFAKGSMLPKVEAALAFLAHNPDGEVAITSLDNLNAYLTEKSGTIIKN